MSQPDDTPEAPQSPNRYAAHLADALRELKIARAKTHYLVFADGSGSNFSRACGHGTVIFDLTRDAEKTCWGGLSSGTVNIAEMLAIIHALDWITNNEENFKTTLRSVVQVHIVTDSKYCEEMGSSGKGKMAKRNAGLWALCETYARRGLALHWHHIRRSTLHMNVVCDQISKMARRLHTAYNVTESLGGDGSA